MTSTAPAAQVTAQLIRHLIDLAASTGEPTVLVQHHDLTYGVARCSVADKTLLWVLLIDDIDTMYDGDPTPAQLDDLAATTNSYLAEGE